jgi:hypothetical protein
MATKSHPDNRLRHGFVSRFLYRFSMEHDFDPAECCDLLGSCSRL